MSYQDKQLRIVFMGTPEFAIPSLQQIIQSENKVVGVVTALDKPAGRGNKIRTSAIKDFALTHNLYILQPENLKAQDFISELKNLHPDLFIVVAFRMLPEVVWSIPPLGTINLHASLLPQYRGAAPINWAIINGENKTGLTTFFIEKDIDTGKIIMQKEVLIKDKDTAGDLHDRLMQLGAELIRDTVQAIKGGTIEALDQDHMVDGISDLKAAPKIQRESCKIDWNSTGKNIYNLIRGLSPYPGAWNEITWEGKKRILKIFSATFVPANHSLATGIIKTDNSTYIHIAANDGYIHLETLQLEGKKRMSVKEFLNGIQDFSNASLIL
jgi:methionyl-tRNA formyltransferase